MRPGFLNGPTDGVVPGSVEPATGVNDDAFSQSGLASYKSLSPGAERRCLSTVLPAGTKLSVENTDNGRRIVCLVATVSNLPEGITVMLDRNMFALLSDLAEAPIPVRLRW